MRPGRAARVPLRTDGNCGQGAGVGADGQLGCRQTRSVRERRRAVRCGTGQPPGMTTPRGRPRVSPATASGCGARPAGLLSPRGAPQGPGAGLTAAPFAHLGLSFPRCVFCVFCAFGQNEGAVATGQAPVAAGGGPGGRDPPMGQLLRLHICCSRAAPTQAWPPCCGPGLLQARVRSRMPPAQVTVQADHGDQGLQRPSTEGERGHRQGSGGPRCGDTGGRAGVRPSDGLSQGTDLGWLCFDLREGKSHSLGVQRPRTTDGRWRPHAQGAQEGL